MSIVPFKRNATPASYSGASGPRSSGRMPANMSTPSIEKDSGPDATATIDAPSVDGNVVVHDRNYPRKSKVQPFGQVKI